MPDHGTAIEWTQAPGYKGETWNPVTGCDRVSPGCAHCYALDLAAKFKSWGQKRYQKDGDPKTSGPGFGLTLHPDKLEEPLRWRKPRMVFVNSMSDLFHEEIPDEFIIRAFRVMAMTPRHVYQVLTKRPERMVELMPLVWATLAATAPESVPFPPPNVWLGVTIENRRFVHRADLLRETPAALRFISAEPLLGPLVPRSADFRPNVGDYGQEHALGEWLWPDGKLVDEESPPLDLTDIDWLIVGGESGPEHRTMQPRWASDLRDAANATQEVGWRCFTCGFCTLDPADIRQGQHYLVCPRCQTKGEFVDWIAGGTAFFFKQWGGHTPKAGGRELDGRTWGEFPTALVPPTAAGGR